MMTVIAKLKVKPGREASFEQAAQKMIAHVKAHEPGTVTYLLNRATADPTEFVFYEIYRSKAAHDFHLQQDFTKKFLVTLKSAQVGDRVRTNLLEVAEEVPTLSN